MEQSVETLRHKTESGVKFSSDQFLLSAFSSLGIHLASNGIKYQEISLGGKRQPVRTADIPVTAVVPNVK